MFLLRVLSSFSKKKAVVQIRQRPTSHSYLINEAWKQQSPIEKTNSLINSKTAHNLKISKKTESLHTPKFPSMIDSYCEVNLPFMDNKNLREDYLSIHGGIRVGMLLEDLDALAASIAYAHCNYGAGKDIDVMLVTAAVDRMKILHSFDLTSFQNIKMSGFVTYVGHSSMEITMAIEQELSPNDKKIAAIARFIFVARSPDGSSSIPINPLIINTPKDEEIIEGALKRKKERSEMTNVIPKTREEFSLFISSPPPPFPKESSPGIPMKDTIMKSVRICHPQQRNIHNRIFGGYLMREALELAYATVVHFMDGDPLVELESIDAIKFVHPVPIGSILEMKSIISKTGGQGGQFIHLELIADVLIRREGETVEERRTTNTFHYTFRTIKPNAKLKKVIPESYEEYLMAEKRQQ